MADLPNTQKHTQGGSQNEETNKHVTNERNSIKSTKQMEESNLLDAEFKTQAISMLNKLRERIGEFSENLYKEVETIKKNHSEIKHIL